MARTKVIDSCNSTNTSITARINPNLHYVRLVADNIVELDAAGVGMLVGALTQWLADRADRL